MIRVKNLSKSFNNKTIIKNISCQFERGKTSLIIGQTGSGKTVFLKCLLGLHDYEKGEILFDGVNFKTISEYEKMKLNKKNVRVKIEKLYSYIKKIMNIFI